MQDLKARGTILLTFVGLMWFFTILDWILFHGRMMSLGIRPRTLAGLSGIFFSPFLHAGFSHLMANTVPFLFLGGLVILDRIRDFFLVTFATLVLGGLGVWLFGPSGTVHIGASGLVFGYLGYLLFRGVFDHYLPWILISIFVGVLYGGLVFGVLPLTPGVSWQSHLFGFLAGVAAARMFKGDRDPRRLGI